MESIATTRNEAQAIQSDIMSRIAAIGVTSPAGAIGVDKSQVSRWQSKGAGGESEPAAGCYRL